MLRSCLRRAKQTYQLLILSYSQQFADNILIVKQLIVVDSPTLQLWRYSPILSQRYLPIRDQKYQLIHQMIRQYHFFGFVSQGAKFHQLRIFGYSLSYVRLSYRKFSYEELLFFLHFTHFVSSRCSPTPNFTEC